MKLRDQFLQPGFSLPGSQASSRRVRFRTIWISDVHLGTTGCQAARLLEFLRATDSERLYLVGDIIDGWQLRRRWYWDQDHNDVVQSVLKKAQKGTEVIFVPGNHDEVVRQFIDLNFGEIKIRDELVHITEQGKKMLVLHGDRFDGVIACEAEPSVAGQLARNLDNDGRIKTIAIDGWTALAAYVAVLGGLALFLDRDDLARLRALARGGRA